jgi:hypothetical protein
MLSLVKKAPNHHCASFEPQRASSFRKRVKDPQLPGEAARTCTLIPLFFKPITLLVVLASSTCGELQLFLSLSFADHQLIRMGDERERLVTASPVMTKNQSRPVTGRNNYPESGLVKPPRRETDTRAHSAAPQSGAEEQTAPAMGAYAQHACFRLFCK